MPSLKIGTPDGNTLNLNYPEGASREEVQGVVDSVISQYEAKMKTSDNVTTDTVVPASETTPSSMKGLTIGDVTSKAGTSGRQLMSMLPQMSPLPDPEAQPDPLSGSRAAAVMTGATAGAMQGATRGPVGMVVGGLLGSMGGSLGHDALLDAQKNVLKVGALKDYEIPSIEQRVQNAIREGTWDAGFNVGLQGLRPAKGAIGDFLLKWGLGVGRKQKDAIRQAASQGVKIGIPEASRWVLVRESANILGRFPIIGTAFKDAQKMRASDVFREADSLFATYGPLVDVAQQSKNLVKMGTKQFKKFRGEVNAMYGIAKDMAKRNNAKFDTSGIIETARQIKKDLVSGQFDRYGRKTVTEPDAAIASLPSVKSPAFKGKTKSVLDLKKSDEAMEPVTKAFNDLTTDLTKMKRVQNMDQLAEVAKRLNKIIELGKRAGVNKDMPEVLALKKSIENAMRTTGDAKVGQAFKAADDYFSNGMKKFETATAKKFGQVDRKVFDAGFAVPGSKEADQLYNTLISETSPEVIKNLRSLLGPQKALPLFKAAARQRLDDAWKAGMSNLEKKGFNKEAFLKQLGILDPKSANAAATNELFSKGVGDISQIRAFADLAETALQQGVPDISTFVSRRAMIGGRKSALKALLPFAATGGSFAIPGTGIPELFLGYYLATTGSRALANPRLFKSLQQVMRYRDQPKLATGAMMRVLQLTPDAVEDSSVPEDPSFAPVMPDNVAPPIAR
tara:strand:- start:2028 stop:4226 length:2199 start_codon:yes stop_codon:yes gene_type:complete